MKNMSAMVMVLLFASASQGLRKPESMTQKEREQLADMMDSLSNAGKDELLTRLMSEAVTVKGEGAP